MPAEDVRARMVALIEELRREGRSQAEIGKIFGRSQGWVSQVLAGTIKASLETAREAARDKLRLDDRFFTDPRARGMSYKPWVGGSPFESTETRRDDLPSPYPEFERAIADENVVDLDVLRMVRGVRFGDGATEATYEEALHQITRAKALARGRRRADDSQPIAVELPPGMRPLKRRAR